MTNSSAAVLIGSMDTSPATFFFTMTQQDLLDFSGFLEKERAKVRKLLGKKY